MSEAPAGLSSVGPAVVEVGDLVKHYRVRGRRGQAVRALDGVSLSVARQRTYGLVGESGSGKTTLGRVLLRLEQPDSGRVTFDGQDWLAKRGEPLRKARKEIQAADHRARDHRGAARARPGRGPRGARAAGRRTARPGRAPG
jgi:ABC-type oligopeptide transport system ATPase subunit